MPVIIPAPYVQITFEFAGPLVPDGVGNVVFGATLGGDSPLAAAERWADAFLPIWTASGSQSLTFTRAIAVTEVSSVETVVDEPGGADGNPAPPGVSLHLRKSTNVRGPRAKGHMYPPGLLYDEQLDVQGRLATTVIDQRQLQFDTFLEDTERNMVILQGSEGISPPIVPPPVVSRLVVDPIASSQRGRQR